MCFRQYRKTKKILEGFSQIAYYCPQPFRKITFDCTKPLKSLSFKSVTTLSAAPKVPKLCSELSGTQTIVISKLAEMSQLCY